MSDLISRQDVEVRVNEYFSNKSYTEKMLKDDIKSLLSAEPKTEWIPVSERLPDKEERVLVTDSGYIEFGKLICGLFGDLWLIWVDDYWEEATKVTAWMPLPEPYREEYELATEQMEHDTLYEQTYNSEDGSI